MSGQLVGAAGRVCRPPREVTLGETLVTEPKALAVVHQYLQRRPLAIAEDEHGAGEGIVLEGFLAQPRQAIDAAAKIGRLDGHQDLHLWRDLEHHRALQK